MTVILHCSDSSFGNAIEINKWHLQRGFSSIGYHFVILNGKLTPTKYNKFFDGIIETGRPIDDDSTLETDEVGAHALGWNGKSIGVCLIGLSDTFTIKQYKAVRELLLNLKSIFGSLDVKQHSDVEPKKPYCAGLSKAQMDIFKNL
jgi:hypothetical protein